jgi:hypothetical protein
MTLPGVIMVMMLISTDGTTSFGVLTYKNYDDCYASLKHPVDKTRYQWAERVCMDDPSTVNSLERLAGKIPQWGGLKSNRKD